MPSFARAFVGRVDLDRRSHLLCKRADRAAILLQSDPNHSKGGPIAIQSY